MYGDVRRTEYGAEIGPISAQPVAADGRGFECCVGFSTVTVARRRGCRAKKGGASMVKNPALFFLGAGLEVNGGQKRGVGCLPECLSAHMDFGKTAGRGGQAQHVLRVLGCAYCSLRCNPCRHRDVSLDERPTR